MNLEQVKALKAGDKIRFKPGTPWGCHETRIVTANISVGRSVHYLGHLSSPGSTEFPNALAWESFTWRDVEKVEEPASVGLDRPEQPIPIGANGMEDKHVDATPPVPSNWIDPVSFAANKAEAYAKLSEMTKEVRVTDPKTGGQKGSKLERFDLIPVGPLTELARVYGRGAQKYADDNWRKGYDWKLSYAALQRHLNLFWGGENLDKDSGQPHMAHAAWHCFTLLWFMQNYPDGDSRAKA